ncbi:hypothetical protein [Acrocarpospora catenulata]|uniref:hypothetical protein n=1 Tax=Acrocarpospora catenulata TaxID=2836182 RepID=UPI001BDA44D6|nr:hypothetical protein [Acrocarpospora catenulata]
MVTVARPRVPRSLYLLVGILTTFVVALAAGLAVLLMVRRTPPATAAETDRCGGHIALLPGTGMERNGTLILDVSAWRLG